MSRYCWTIGGGMSPANSMAELREFYGRSGNLQSSFRAFEVDDSGASRDITSQVQTRGGCFVATAVFGGYDVPEVRTLRRFRDERLSKSPGGRWFIRSYYSVGPHLASAVNGKPRVKRVLRVALGMAVRSIARRL